MKSEIDKLLLMLKQIHLLTFCVLFSNIVGAEQKLDIRPYEASDVCSTDIAQIRVFVNNVGEGGILTVELYHDPDNFLSKKGRSRRIRIPALSETHRVCFGIELEGTYAVAAYHDIDANRKLKKRWNMMPKEPFGLSQNPELKMGFPKFNNSAFSTDSTGANIEINLQKP